MGTELRLLQALTTPPFEQAIPIDLRPLHGKSTLSLLWRRMRPMLALRLAGQLHRQTERIDPAARRILWIYKGTPQIGDALMDLSSRVLLRGLPVQVDLLTDAHLARMFACDSVFVQVHADIATVERRVYDLVILDSFKARCLRDKLQHLRSLPFVTMRGYFSGPEFNRTLFSFYRMRQLLGMTADVGLAQMRPSLESSGAERASVDAIMIGGGALAIAVGGVVAERIYPHWAEVVGLLLEQKLVEKVVLVGSENGGAMAQRIVARYGGAPVIINCVGEYSLGATMEILRRCAWLACSDGGLMHLAAAGGTPVVALFDQAVSPQMRIIDGDPSIGIQSSGAVSALSPAVVGAAIATALRQKRVLTCATT